MGADLFFADASASKRIVDLLVALLLLLLLAPFILLLLLLGLVVLQRHACVGRYGVLFQRYALLLPANGLGRYLAQLGLDQFPVLLNIAKGDMSFVGPRATRPGELSLRGGKVRKRFAVRPGLLCLWWIRERSNIAYGDEVSTDIEYVDSSS